MTDYDQVQSALARWARSSPLSVAGEEAALSRIFLHVDAMVASPAAAGSPERHRWRLLGVLAMMAASLAVLLLARPGGLHIPGRDAAVATQMADASAEDAAAFALLYTPTDEEEYQL